VPYFNAPPTLSLSTVRSSGVSSVLGWWDGGGRVNRLLLWSPERGDTRACTGSRYCIVHEVVRYDIVSDTCRAKAYCEVSTLSSELRLQGSYWRGASESSQMGFLPVYFPSTPCLYCMYSTVLLSTVLVLHCTVRCVLPLDSVLRLPRSVWAAPTSSTSCDGWTPKDQGRMSSELSVSVFTLSQN
jgi:hypothetical protein